MDVDAIFIDSEGARQYKGEEDSKQGGREDTALFDSFLDETALSYRTVLFMLL